MSENEGLIRGWEQKMSHQTKIDEKASSIARREKAIQRLAISYYHERKNLDNRQIHIIADLTAHYARLIRRTIEHGNY